MTTIKQKIVHLTKDKNDEIVNYNMVNFFFSFIKLQNVGIKILLASTRLKQVSCRYFSIFLQSIHKILKSRN